MAPSKSCIVRVIKRELVPCTAMFYLQDHYEMIRQINTEKDIAVVRSYKVLIVLCSLLSIKTFILALVDVRDMHSKMLLCDYFDLMMKLNWPLRIMFSMVSMVGVLSFQYIFVWRRMDTLKRIIIDQRTDFFISSRYRGRPVRENVMKYVLLYVRSTKWSKLCLCKLINSMESINK